MSLVDIDTLGDPHSDLVPASGGGARVGKSWPGVVAREASATAEVVRGVPQSGGDAVASLPSTRPS